MLCASLAVLQTSFSREALFFNRLPRLSQMLHFPPFSWASHSKNSPWNRRSHDRLSLMVKSYVIIDLMYNIIIHS